MGQGYPRQKKGVLSQIDRVWLRRYEYPKMFHVWIFVSFFAIW